MCFGSRGTSDFSVSDTSLRRPGRAPYRDEATAVVWIGLPVLIDAKNMTSFHLEQTINERIHLRKTGNLREKRAARAARCLRFEIFRKRFLSLHFDPISHFIYMQVHDVLRNYLARMRAFDGSRSLLTVENRSQLTVIFFDWSDKNSCSISYEKWGKTDNLLVTQNLAHNYFIPCFSSYLLVTSSAWYVRSHRYPKLTSENRCFIKEWL